MDGTWWQCVFAVPVGLLILAAWSFIELLVAKYISKSIGVIIILAFSFLVGGAFLGLF